MSLILDALRGARAPAPPAASPTTAQTDAVLRTLGYGGVSSASPVSRLKRLAGYLVAGIVLAVLVWGTVTWVTRAYLTHKPPMDAHNDDRPVVLAPPAGVALPAQPMSAASNDGAPVSEDEHFQLALHYQRIGDAENSLVHYRAVLQRNDRNAEAHNNLGLLYRDKGLLDDAIKEFARAVAVNPRYAKAHDHLGMAYLSQRRNDAAAAEFRMALKIDPQSVESLVNLSLAEKDAGRRDNARVTLARAIEIDPHSEEAHYNLALIADDMGDKALALAAYRAFLQNAGDHPYLVPEVRKRIGALSR